MPIDYGPVFWPAWNTKFGRDTDPADDPVHMTSAEIYVEQRAWEKRRLAERSANQARGDRRG